ncbi:triose-phosphate isomerase family protein [Candidatus Tisiphia endosymbiont of Beris chalybata]|uniref:triose-phosphate isomerase n=1 Tax=Candidatus Tisiphia endosymbiont of Beris chalybata TaxID=3066262 RepID=UPI00312C79A8
MKKLIIANWKMNMSLTDACAFCIKLSALKYDNSLIIAPPSLYLAYLSDKFKFLTFCAQNVSRYEGQGSYTGEYSSLLLKLSNINYAIVGHSDRRNLFNETNEIIKQKVEKCLQADITPIICIGEDLKARQNKNYQGFLLSQLTETLPNSYKMLNKNKNIIIAYEPIWAIGTGSLPLQEELIEIFMLINSFLKESQVANNVRLVYGGSVNLDNTKQILRLPYIDGVMVGKSSLNPPILFQMLNYGCL